MKIKVIVHEEENGGLWAEKERNPEFSTAKSLLKHAGKWKGPKEEYERILKYIKENRIDAKF